MKTKTYGLDEIVKDLEMTKRAIQNVVFNPNTGDIEYDTPMFMLDDIMNKLINTNKTMIDITQFNHWGFAEWVENACKDQPNQTLNIKVFYDEENECYYIDLHNADDLDEFNALESFHYMDIPEIQHDIAEAMNQLPIFINLIRQDQ